MSADSDHLLAAELALGVLDLSERAEAEARLARDEAFAHEVAAWEARFAPLLDAVAPATPPAGAWARIAAALPPEMPAAPASARPAAREPWTRRLALWRGLALGAGTLAAAALAGVAVLLPGAPRTAEAPLVAALAPAPGGRAEFVVTVLRGSAPLVVPTGAVIPADRVAELWVIPAAGQPAAGQPHSLGVLRPEGLPPTGAVAAALRPGATLAITLEPPGGGPGGRPSGPVIASGTLAGAR